MSKLVKMPTIGNKPKEWLTDAVKEAALERAKPWIDEGHEIIEHFDGMAKVRHHRVIQRKLDDADDGTLVVAALPPKSKVTSRFNGGWTVIHERLKEDSEGPSVLIVRKGSAKRNIYRIFVPRIWQVGDTFSMFALFRELKKQLLRVEFYFDHDVRYVFPEANVVSRKEGLERAWDGVINHNPERSEISLDLRWKIHFYKCPVEIAKRMGWIPPAVPSSTDLEAYPFTDEDLQWAVEKIPNDSNYVVLVPKAGWWPRQWPEQQIIRVAQYLDQCGVRTVILGKDKVDCEIEGYEWQHMTDLQDQTDNIGKVAAVMDNSQLVVCPDTGLIHIAGSLGKEIIAPWGPSVHRLTGPVGSTPVFGNETQCQECYGDQKAPFHSKCNYRADCIKQISTMQVVDTVLDRLGLDIEPFSISLCMMVKNEEKMLPGAIQSAADLADEVIVVDTGSTDGTKSWLAEHPEIKVYDYDIGDEIQSFSEVRNFAFSKATGRYVMWLDACEMLLAPKNVRSLVEKEYYDCYAMPIQHANIRYTREKIMPRAFAHFLDKIHEFMSKQGVRDGTVPASMGVFRRPYEKQDREGSESRNIRLLKAQLKEEPKSARRPRWLYYLGRDLADARRFDEAIPYLNERVFLTGFYEERFAAGVLLARILIYEKKNYEKAERIGQSLVGLNKKLREGHYIIAESHYWRGEYEKALKLYTELIKMDRPEDATMWLWEEVYTWLPYDRMSRIWEQLGDKAKALTIADHQLKMAPPSERGWITERIKSISGVPTLVEDK